MTEPLDETYLKWLYQFIGSVRTRDKSKSYWKLARQLHRKEFIWLIPNDDNRADDGKDLRYEFVEDAELDDVDPEWMELGCSMLELLIALSRRLAFHGEGEPRDWFWCLIENIGIDHYNDRVHYHAEIVEEALDTVIWRTYNRDGTAGGLFPLRRAHCDQTEVELWHQLNEYLLER